MEGPHRQIATLGDSLAMTRRGPFFYSLLDVQVAHFLGAVLDELPARLDSVAHEKAENGLGLDGVLGVDLEDGAGVRVHGGLPELLRVHLPQALVTLDGCAGP